MLQLRNVVSFSRTATAKTSAGVVPHPYLCHQNLNNCLTGILFQLRFKSLWKMRSKGWLEIQIPPGFYCGSFPKVHWTRNARHEIGFSKHFLSISLKNIFLTEIQDRNKFKMPRICGKTCHFGIFLECRFLTDSDSSNVSVVILFIFFIDFTIIFLCNTCLSLCFNSLKIIKNHI